MAPPPMEISSRGLEQGRGEGEGLGLGQGRSQGQAGVSECENVGVGVGVEVGVRVGVDGGVVLTRAEQACGGEGRRGWDGIGHGEGHVRWKGVDI